MPRVAQFSIAPVRSLGLQHPTEIDVTEVGVVEDRRFFLTNDANRLIDQLVVFELVQVESRTDPGATMLWLRFPDGTIVDGEVELGAAIETPIHGRTGVGHVVVGQWAYALCDFVVLNIEEDVQALFGHAGWTSELGSVASSRNVDLCRRSRGRCRSGNRADLAESIRVTNRRLDTL